jgi:hypothetical protein
MANSIKDIFPDPKLKQLNPSFGRRSGLDRRQFIYDSHIPENRSGIDNRKAPERRVQKDRRLKPDRRAVSNRRDYKGSERRVLKFRRSDANRRTIK